MAQGGGSLPSIGLAAASRVAVTTTGLAGGLLNGPGLVRIFSGPVTRQAQDIIQYE